MKPYLISAATKDSADKYLQSVKNLGDSIEPAHFWFDEYPGHMHRLDGIKELSKGLDPKRWWIFTDTSDVTFQRPFPSFETTPAGIIATDEGVTHTNNFWEHYITMYPMFTPLLKKPVYNCGAVAMYGTLFLEYIEYFQHFRDVYLPSHVPQMIEQLIFNMFVQKNWNLVYENPSIFCALSSNYENKSALKGTDGIWVDAMFNPLVVVHRNGKKKDL